MIRLIVASDRQRGLAKQGILPWHIPADVAYFAQKTKSDGAVVLMGSTTFKSMQRPLPERKNYVLTSDDSPISGVELIHHLENFLKDYRGDEQHLWAIGGANVFEQIFEAGLADELYITRIEADFGCTQFFPDFSDNFQLVSESDLQEQNGFLFTYQVYAKVLDNS